MATLATVGCGGNNDPEEFYSVDSRVILHTSPSSVALSEIAESVEIIKLETRDDLLIGQDPVVAIEDSLLLVYYDPPFGVQQGGGIYVFNSRTGRYSHSIPGFRERGPRGYSSSFRPIAVNKNTVLLNKGIACGLWDFTTGKMLADDIPIGASGLRSAFFLDDISVIIDRLWIDPGTPDKVEVISTLDGSVIRGLGQAANIDQSLDGNTNRSRLYEYGNYVSYYSMVCDTIYGINKKTLQFSPRYVLNLGSKLFPDVKGGIFAEGYLYVTSLCESDRYLFLTYLDGPWNSPVNHLVYYDKKEGRTVYVDRMQRNDYSGGFDDDLSPLGAKFFPQEVTADGRAFSVVQAVEVIDAIGPERAAELDISEDDNPVIVVAHLKNE